MSSIYDYRMNNLRVKEYANDILKRHNRTKWIRIVLALLGYLGAVFAILFYSFHKITFLQIILLLLVVIMFGNYLLKITTRKNMRILCDSYKRDLDVENSLILHKTLLDLGSDLTIKGLVLNSYLNLLLDCGQLDEFFELCQKHKYGNKLLYNNIILMQKILSISNQSEKYHKFLAKYRFSRYHKKKGKLSYIKDNRRKQDRLFEILQFYEAKEYRQVIEKIDGLSFDNSYEELYYRSYKERALYHLKENYLVPDETCYPFIFVKQWGYLVETGEEYKCESISKILLQVEQFNKKGKRFSILIKVFALIYIVAMILYFDNSVLNHKGYSPAFYTACVESFDFRVEEVYGLCSDEDLAGAMVYAKNLRNSELEEYYFTIIDYYQEGTKSMMELKDIPISIMFYTDSTKIFALQGDESTYVTVLTENNSDIRYNGSEIDNLLRYKLPEVADVPERVAYAFIVSSNYKEELVTIDGKTLDEIYNP